MFKNFGKDKDESKKEGADKEKGFSFSFGKKDESPPKVRGPSVAELQEQIESMQEQMAMLSQERRKEVTLARVTCCVPSSCERPLQKHLENLPPHNNYRFRLFVPSSWKQSLRT
jgi:hypothetical protein